MATPHRSIFHAEVLRQKTLALHPDYRQSQIRLDDDDRAVLRRVNGQATVATIGQLTGLGDDAMTRIVLRLVARRKLVFADDLPFLDETALAAAVLERVEGAEPAKLLRLDEIDQALLAAVDGQTRVRDVARTLGGERGLVFVNVVRLLLAGLLRVNRAARPAPVRAEPPPPEPIASPPPSAAASSEPVAGAVGEPAPAFASFARRPLPRRWVALAFLVSGAALLAYVAIVVLGTVTSHLASDALTVEGLAEVIELSEIKLGAGKHWSAVARESFGQRPRRERVRAAQELVRRVQDGGFRQLEVRDESGAILFEWSQSVLTVHDLERPEPGGSSGRSRE